MEERRSQEVGNIVGFGVLKERLLPVEIRMLSETRRNGPTISGLYLLKFLRFWITHLSLLLVELGGWICTSGWIDVR
jgi:hypothetical protein